MGLPVTVYHRPGGRQEQIICREIDDDDTNWFQTRSVKVSMESDGRDGYIVYADYGAVDEEGEPDEIIVLSQGRSCRKTLSELRELTERAMVS